MNFYVTDTGCSESHLIFVRFHIFVRLLYPMVLKSISRSCGVRASLMLFLNEPQVLLCFQVIL